MCGATNTLRCVSIIFKYQILLFIIITDLFLILKFLTIEAVEQQGKEEVEHHKVAHNECGQEYEEATLCPCLLLRAHTVPQRLDPLAAKYPEYHHERVEEVVEVPPSVVDESGLLVNNIETENETNKNMEHTITCDGVLRKSTRTFLLLHIRESIK